MSSPFFIGIGSIKDSNLILFCIDISNEIIKAWLCYHFSHLIVFMIIVIEEITGELDIMIYVFDQVPIIYFLL